MITLYSTHCPKCRVVELKLQQKDIEYIVVDDVEEVTLAAKNHGISTAPFIEVNDEFYEFKEAIKLINEVTNNEYRTAY